MEQPIEIFSDPLWKKLGIVKVHNHPLIETIRVDREGTITFRLHDKENGRTKSGFLWNGSEEQEKFYHQQKEEVRRLLRQEGVEIDHEQYPYSFATLARTEQLSNALIALGFSYPLIEQVHELLKPVIQQKLEPSLP